MARFIVRGLALFLAGWASQRVVQSVQPPAAPAPASRAADQARGDAPMRLGNFSVSLKVKDVAASRAFYEKLGFKTVFGDGKGFQIMQSDTATIGLFQSGIERTTLTFNPGWDRAMKALGDFEDVRDLQKEFKKRGLKPKPEADESTNGPAYFVLADPDGNPVVFDQHVGRAGK